MTAHYASIGHCTANEDGLEEVEAVYQRTFWQWLFRQPAKKSTWVRAKNSRTWYMKGSAKPCTVPQTVELMATMAILDANKIGE